MIRVLLVGNVGSLADSIAVGGGVVLKLTQASGVDALRIAYEGEFDTILLEVGPGTEAPDLVQRMRLAKIRAPILLLSQSDRIIEIVRTLSAGADDYLTRPFAGEDFIKRVFALNREHSARVRPTFTIGELTINLERGSVHANGKRIHLTNKEFQILELLATHAGTTVTKTMVFDRLYAGAYEPVIKIVDVYLCKLRQKLNSVCEENYIKTVWGRGYCMRAPDENAIGIRRAAAA